MRNANESQEVVEGFSLKKVLGKVGWARLYLLTICLILLVFYVLLIPHLGGLGSPGWGQGNFVSFWTAALMVRTGNAHQLYNRAEQAQLQQALTQPCDWSYEDGLLPYCNPPFSAILFVPLTTLTLVGASGIWSLANLAVVALAAKLLADHQGKHSLGNFLVASLVIFAFFPVFHSLWMGQSSLLILLNTYAMVRAAGMASYLDLIRQLSALDGVYGVRTDMLPNLRGMIYRFGQFLHGWLGCEPFKGIDTAVTPVHSLLLLAWLFHLWKGRWLGRSKAQDYPRRMKPSISVFRRNRSGPGLPGSRGGMRGAFHSVV